MANMRSNTIITLLNRADANLGDLLVLAAVKAHSGPDGRCHKSVPQLAERLKLHPRTARQRMRRLAELGDLREHPVHALAHMAHEVTEPDYGAVVEFDPANLRLGDALAVNLLLVAKGGAFSTRLDDLAATAGVSRDTLSLDLKGG